MKRSPIAKNHCTQFTVECTRFANLGHLNEVHSTSHRTSS